MSFDITTITPRLTPEEAIAASVARWSKPRGTPFKGSLIDREALAAHRRGGGSDADVPYDCMCAQGQALHFELGIPLNTLAAPGFQQHTADTLTMHLYGISRAHAIFLRRVNDNVDGAPSNVLINPEALLGPNAEACLALWHLFDRMKIEDWRAAYDKMLGRWPTAAVAAEAAAAAEAEAEAAEAAAAEAGLYPWHYISRYSTIEIIGYNELMRCGKSLYFLPFLGFNTPADVIAAYQKGRGA